MKYPAGWFKPLFAAFALFIALAVPSLSVAADMPLAAASPLTGVGFDDRPLLLPVQRNFQMAMLTASSEMGRSCGKMEAYGWRMGQTEQERVNRIFNSTVDRLRLLGYNITPQALTSVSNDITMFTADKTNRHFMFLWSAGELGLVMNLCETSAPLRSSAPAAKSPTAPSVQVFPVDVVTSHLDAPPTRKAPASGSYGFTPLGEWSGAYTCAQGTTGGTLKITHAKGEDFEGVFKFYPTVKSPNVPSGTYEVSGQYDAETKRALINPGKWINRPRGYYNTVIVGSFDAANDSFSGMFQGIVGCTSFEAKRNAGPIVDQGARKKAPAAKKAKAAPVKKKTSAKKPAVQSKQLPPLSAPTAPVASDPAVQQLPVGIQVR